MHHHSHAHTGNKKPCGCSSHVISCCHTAATTAEGVQAQTENNSERSTSGDGCCGGDELDNKRI